jgi:signal peptidase II
MTARLATRPAATPMLHLGLAIAAVVLIADQIVKAWILSWLGPAPVAVALSSFVNLVSVWNYGISFGLFNTGSAAAAYLFVIMALAIASALVVWLKRTDRRLIAVALGLVIGGAIGNIVDRLRFGAVYDFLDFHVLGWHWPAFNVADTGVSVGVALLLIDALFASSPSSK